MIKQTSLNFLIELKNNNSKVWFEQIQILYQAYKDNIIEITEKILSELSKVGLSISNANLIPKKCLTRINRDLRFSKDKTPYKKHFQMVFRDKVN